MKEIELTQGKTVLVDDDDFVRLNQFKWFANKLRNTYYAVRTNIKEKPSTIYMHRFIMCAPKNMEVDHIDGNGLNNQKSNLRICTRLQNSHNTRIKNVYTGVSKVRGKYIRAYIKHEGKQIHLGLFNNEIDAAKAHDVAALKLRGEFAKLNFKL